MKKRMRDSENRKVDTDRCALFNKKYKICPIFFNILLEYFTDKIFLLKFPHFISMKDFS